MLSLRKHINTIFTALAFVTTTNAYAGLYGFSQMDIAKNISHAPSLPRHIMNYRSDLRELISSVADYGKSKNKNFQILIHEGQYFFDKSLWEYHLKGYNKIRKSDKLIDDASFLSNDIPYNHEDKSFSIKRFRSLIDGIVVNNHYCHKSPLNDIIKDLNISIFSIEECPSDNDLDNAIAESFKDNIAIYPFLHRDEAFRKITRQLIINETANGIHKVSEARNISFLINDEKFSTPYQMIDEIRKSNYDIIVIHPVFHNKTPFTKEEVDMMKFKKNGAPRLIISLFNISEISEYSYLWQKRWNKKLPEWIADISPVNPNSYIVKYWFPEWRTLASKYLRSIIDTQYDGIFLTGIENHAYFEQNTPLE